MRAGALIGLTLLGMLAPGCGGGAAGADVDAARGVSLAVGHRFGGPVPVEDIRCGGSSHGRVCTFDTRQGHVTCSVTVDVGSPPRARCGRPLAG